jgi:hypothetical protein
MPWLWTVEDLDAEGGGLMTTLIPRADLLSLAEKYNDSGNLEGEWTVDRVRQAAKRLRVDIGRTLHPHILLAMADDLDALADRYEKEAGA